MSLVSGNVVASGEELSVPHHHVMYTRGNTETNREIFGFGMCMGVLNDCLDGEKILGD